MEYVQNDSLVARTMPPKTEPIMTDSQETFIDVLICLKRKRQVRNITAAPMHAASKFNRKATEPKILSLLTDHPNSVSNNEPGGGATPSVGATSEYLALSHQVMVRKAVR